MGNYSECLLHNFFILISKQYQTVHKSECDEVKETRHSVALDHERDGDDDDGPLLLYVYVLLICISSSCTDMWFLSRCISIRTAERPSRKWAYF
jgi:hypothetical protein